MTQKVTIGIIVAIIVIGGVIWYAKSHKASAPMNTNGNTVETNENSNDEFTGDVPGDTPNTSNTPSTATVAVSTQLPGNSVTIDNVFLEKAGFVVISEVNSKGQAGAIVGSSGYLGTGAKQDLEITANMKPGAKYIAQLREDNGDKKFSDSQDKIVTNNNIGVMTMFSVSQ